MDLKNYVSQLLKLYKKYPALYGADNDPEGFEWINSEDGDRSIFSFARKSPTKRNNLLAVFNFTPMERTDYRVGVLKNKQHKLIFTEKGFLEEPEVYKPEKINMDNRDYSIGYKLPPYGVAIFQY